MYETWSKSIKEKIKRLDTAKELKGKYSSLCNIELGLYLLEKLNIHRTEELWVLLSRYPFPEYDSYTQDQKMALSNGRIYLDFGQHSLNELLTFYQTIKPVWRLYNILEDETFQREHLISKLPDREAEYKRALEIPPVLKIYPSRFPSTGIPVFFNHFGTGNVISALIDRDLVSMAEKANNSIPKLPELPKEKRKPISVSFDELKLYAGQLSRYPHCQRDWLFAVQEIIRFRPVKNTASGETIVGEVNQGNLIIDGMMHVAGMVGAGKSTLAELLAMYGAERGDWHTTLIVGDTLTAIELAARINNTLDAPQNEPVAIPLLGRTTRGDHFQKVKASPGTNTYQWGMSWLNSTCLLQGMVSLESLEYPLPQGSEPCEYLEQKSKDTNQTSNFSACPLYSLCPARMIDRKIPMAKVWVTTPQAMVLSRLMPQQDLRRLRLSEMIYHFSDLVIFDEINSDQQVLDDIFAPERRLIDDRKGGDLCDLDRDSSGWFGQSPRTPIHIRRRRALSYAQIASEHIGNMLETHKILQQWAEKIGYFSPSMMFRDISRNLNKLIHIQKDDTIESDQEKNPFLSTLWAFQEMDKINLPKADNHDLMILREILRNSLFGGNNQTDYQPDAVEWIKIMLAKESADCADVSDSQLKELALKLEFSIALSGLEYFLYELGFTYPEDADDGDNELQAPDFRRMIYVPEEFIGALPASPLGSVSGFRFTSAKLKDTSGRDRHLQYFRFITPGRYFLMNFPYLFANSGRPGPNTLCMSGTSWMEDFDTYHFAVRPTGILEAPEKAIRAIQKSEFYFHPLRDSNGNSIKVSGSGNLDNELVKMAVSLSGSPQISQSLLSLTMQRLIDMSTNEEWKNRQRILILVNSYNQAKLVAQTISTQIRSEKPDWRVQYLVRATGDEAREQESYWEYLEGGAKRLSRPNLSNIGMTDVPTVLVAPLLAVGRRHNILNQEGTAAFGAIFFATRPMKTPDDISRWVYWINYQTIKMLQNPNAWEWYGASNPKDRLLCIRRQMNYWWSRIEGYKPSVIMRIPSLRRSMAATMAAIVIQASGRLLRGGVPLLAYFLDAAWAPGSASLKSDTNQTSLLVEMINIIGEYCQNPIGQTLFDPLNTALQNIKGLEIKNNSDKEPFEDNTEGGDY